MAVAMLLPTLTTSFLGSEWNFARTNMDPERYESIFLGPSVREIRNLTTTAQALNVFQEFIIEAGTKGIRRSDNE